MCDISERVLIQIQKFMDLSIPLGWPWWKVIASARKKTQHAALSPTCFVFEIMVQNYSILNCKPNALLKTQIQECLTFVLCAPRKASMFSECLKKICCTVKVAAIGLWPGQARGRFFRWWHLDWRKHLVFSKLSFLCHNRFRLVNWLNSVNAPFLENALRIETLFLER